jgi:hypothetical protein
MKDVIAIEIERPPAEVSALMTDPRQNTRWMDDIARVEPVSGELGTPGSRYRLVPKKGNRVFVATIVSSGPNEARLSLEAPQMSVEVITMFRPAGDGRTNLISDQTFAFQGMIAKAFGVFARWAIHKAHRRHMEAFKRFAESRA